MKANTTPNTNPNNATIGHPPLQSTIYLAELLRHGGHTHRQLFNLWHAHHQLTTDKPLSDPHRSYRSARKTARKLIAAAQGQPTRVTKNQSGHK